MANSNPQWSGRAGQISSSPGANSPLSPGTGANNPISFRTNVNRAKTKRWVEAKQYSYDGGDWGDEDEEDEHEHEHEQPPPVPRPPYVSHRTGSSSELSSRRLSGLAAGAEGSRRSPSLEGRPIASGDGQVSHLVRPVDLYKRMREEAPVSSVQPSSVAPPTANPGSDDSSTVDPNASSQATSDTLSMALPEVKRMSGFDTNFLGASEPGPHQIPGSESQNTTLQHNPSQASQSSEGFRSVVHQAFDVPETPISTSGSVVRSNSDGTSIISPIMSKSAFPDDKTPTIPEEPADTGTPTAASQDSANSGPAFMPGHRRDLSLPSRDNSPSKRPVVTDQQRPSAIHAELSSVSPSDQDYAQPQSPNVSMGGDLAQIPANLHEKDYVAPLKFGSTGTGGSEGYRGEIPQIIPSVSAGNSPQDTDNDRLREEIIRSLSRENSQEPEPSRQPRTEQDKDESIPHQYEKYWDSATGPSPTEAQKPLVSESHPDWTESHPLGVQDPYGTKQHPDEVADASTEPPTKPRLGRRFSWESSSSADEPEAEVPVAQSSPDPLDTETAIQEVDPLQMPSAQGAPDELSSEPLRYNDERPESQRTVEKPRLSIVPPVPESSSPPEQIMGPVDAPPNQRDMPLTTKVESSVIDETKLQGFREILNISVPAERIRAFDHTRNQFAALDTGLHNWVQSMAQEKPEHADVVQQSQSKSGLPHHSPTRSKFSKLSSLGNLTASREDSTPTGTGHIRRPSGHIGTIVNRQNVEQRGKDLLHTAGVFGGKAGGAAKGLFAKGRSKFRASGDKEQPITARSGLPFSYTPESNGSRDKSNRHGSITLSNLPVFKFGQNETPPAFSSVTTGEPSPVIGDRDNSQGDERASKRFRSSGSVDLLRTVKTSTRPHSMENADNSDYKKQFDREVSAALGLSPTESESQRKQPMGAVRGLDLDEDGDRRPEPPAKDMVVPSENNGVASKGEKANVEKTLPLLPEQRSEIGSSSVIVARSKQRSMHIIDAMVPSIRPVIDEEIKPSIPPKDVPAKDAPPTPPKDIQYKVASSQEASSQDVSPKDVLPKDVSPKEASAKNVISEHIASQEPPIEIMPSDNNPQKMTPELKLALPSQTEHYNHRYSVSTLGEEEARTSYPAEGEVDTPPSPLEEPVDWPKDSSYDSQFSPSKAFGVTLPSVEDKMPGLEPVNLSRPPSSAEIVDLKRRSIGGFPYSAPGVHSPLRNEVRYSPATRSSMLSFGSFGRQTAGSKDSRPSTPVTRLHTRMWSNSSGQTGDSKREKLKNFGKRRRASVGDLLSGIQGGLQSLQLKSNQQEPQGSGHQRKRTFGKISGIFGRQQESQPADSKADHTKRKTSGLPDKSLPALPLNNDPNDSAVQNKRSVTPLVIDKALPEAPVFESIMPMPRRSTDSASSATYSQRRASIQLPPSASANSLVANRFYSQRQSSEAISPSQHTRARTQPILSQLPSPAFPSEPKGSGLPSSTLPSQVHELSGLVSLGGRKGSTEESCQSQGNIQGEDAESSKACVALSQDQHSEKASRNSPSQKIAQKDPDGRDREVVERSPVPDNTPRLSVRSSKPMVPRHIPTSAHEISKTNAIAVPNASNVSKHPHKTQILTETHETAEPSIHDDASSEEVIMSSTAYPGQEWVPMQYF